MVFDACTWISDHDVQEAGFDPATRKRGKDRVAEYTYLTCDFDSDRGVRLAIESSNISLEEVEKKYSGKTERISVNGREALFTRKSDSTCSVDIQTRAGYFGITLNRGPETVDSCDNIVDTAAILEPSVGKEN
ncbi:hypothetical protein GCM10023318_51240 [Nocardia callitridis]|uniref:DUF3558 domain-containing protein n=1 Tax=Nocardia callitridis TaxID=648753 RepID=A0ABP9KSZ3_9NOCA